MGLFNKNKENNTVGLDNLLNVRNNKDLFKALTFLQNDITVGFNTKIIAVTSLDNDNLAAAFAKAFSDVYSANNLSCLIIDANLYDPCLNKVLSNNRTDSSMFIEVRDTSSISGGARTGFSSNRTKTISMDRSIYPSDVYKNKGVHQIVNDNINLYDRIIILVPSIKKHKEIALLSDIIGSVLLIAQRGITKKEDIFNAIQFCEENKLPLAKTIVVK